MKALPRFVFKVIATLLFLALPSATSVQAEPLAPEVTGKIDRLVSTLIDRTGAPGVSVAVATDNQLCYAKGFGLADVENDVAATAETRFRTASIAKSMTAVVILSLAEEGAIDLDAEVRRYCPDYPQKRWPVTVRQLLGHLGGVRHYKSASETRSTRHFFSLKSALSTFANDPLVHQPGTRFRYTTFGYNLLGSVAEGASGHRFPVLLQQKVFGPAGMSGTITDDQLSLIPRRTRGYLRATESLLKTLPEDHNLDLGRIYNAPLHDTSMKLPGGGLLSTAPDLVRFAVAANSKRLLNDASLQQMWTSQTTTNGNETGYGLGWQVRRHAGRKTVSHSGGQAGTSTFLLLVPETGTSVAIMCNLQQVGLRNLAAEIADAVQPSPQIDYAAAIEKLQAAIRDEVDQKQLPAFSLSLVDRDQVVWADGFGFEDVEKKRPATADTVYRVGSVSKLFTDIAVLQLVESGQLDLDAPIQTYLPDFKPKNPFGTPLTVRQMMSHRSGLVRESPVGNYFDPSEPSLAATIESLNDTSLVYPPETKTKYSNAAIAVVGSVLEKQLDVSHPERVRETILNPLKMNGSSFVVTQAVQPATGWMRTYDGRRFAAPGFLLGTGPAGNLYSSVLDLSKFLSCLFADGKTADGQVLKPETLDLMMTPIQDTDGTPQGFGLGFHVNELDGHTRIGHGGAVYGFSTQLEALPARKLGVVAASSLDGTNGVVRRLTDYALRLMLAAQDGKTLPAYRMTEPVPPQRARELLGTYQEVDGQRITRISEFNGDVVMRRGSFQHRLGAASDDGSIITDDEVGFGTEVKLQSSDRLLVDGKAFQRVRDEPPAEIAEHWQGLIGEYGWDHNTLYILEDAGKLYALIEWFYYYPLTEVDEDTFTFPNDGLYHGEGLKFTRNANGVATDVVAAEVKFLRREVGTKDGETFKITPVKPIAELRNQALAATPPVEQGDFRATDLVDLVALDPTIKLDIRYATTNNFTGSVFYKQPRAFMQRPAAEAVVRANQRLKARGLGLLIHDAYRPWHVTKMFWDATPSDLKDFVANPANGSRHNRGCAVDLTLYDLRSGQPIQMVAGYDEFSPRSFPLYPGGTSRQRWYRALLRRTMESEGFTIYEYEWWHFDYQDWKKYRIGNATFEEVLQTNAGNQPEQGPAIGFEIERTVAGHGFDGKSCWVHARSGAIPAAGEDGSPLVVMTTQKLLLSGSDVFYALNELQSADLGKTWTKPQRKESFARKTIDARTEMTVCDFTPKWHAATGKLLGTGHTVWYRDNKVMKVRPRATAYAVFDPETKEWSKWQELVLPDEPRFKNCGAGSVQRYDLSGGDILLPVYLKTPQQKQYSVSVFRCRFDGQQLTFVEQGNELTIDVKRGLYEPSLTKFGDLFFLTMRNDDHGYVSTSRDGLQFDKPRRWTFDDGAELGNYNTQQHWVTHSNGLFLVYTRKGANNDHVFRHRAPLFIAQVDPSRTVVVRDTEQILVPERGARLGNFGVVDISPSETWVTVTEWMQTWGPNYVMPVDNKYGADNSIHVAKLKWSQPNRLVSPSKPN